MLFLVRTCSRRPGRSPSQPHVQRPCERHVADVREGRDDQPGPVPEILVAVKEPGVCLPRNDVVRRLLRNVSTANVCVRDMPSPNDTQEQEKSLLRNSLACLQTGIPLCTRGVY